MIRLVLLDYSKRSGSLHFSDCLTKKIIWVLALFSFFVVIEAECIRTPTKCSCAQRPAGSICLRYINGGLGNQICETYRCGKGFVCTCDSTELCDIVDCPDPPGYRPASFPSGMNQLVSCTQIVNKKCIIPPSISVRVTSAGFDDGDTIDIQIDGQSAFTSTGSSPGRGINIATIDEGTGAVMSTSTFDTSTSPLQNKAMQNLLMNLPAGRVIALGIKHDASKFLDSKSKNLYKDLGSKAADFITEGSSWALIGRVGFPAETKEDLRLSSEGSADISKTIIVQK